MQGGPPAEPEIRPDIRMNLSDIFAILQLPFLSPGAIPFHELNR